MVRQTTLLELVMAVSQYASSDAEIVATVVHMVNSGMVQLCGTFRGARFDLHAVGVTATAA
jgi:thymidine phosphorylase